MTAQCDVVVIGGGVIGLTTAFFLARDHDLSVTVLDRQDPGREASWAGAGILPPARFEFATSPLSRLLGLSVVMFPELSAELRDRSGIDNEFAICGGIEFASGIRPDTVNTWREEQIRFDRMSGPDLQRLEPALSSTVEPGYYLPDMGQVRNPRHIQALIHACRSIGVTIRPHAEVKQFERSGERILAAATPTDSIAAAHFLIAAGAWSDSLLGPFLVRPTTVPIRGQIVLYRHEGPPLLRAVVNQGKNYLVPRKDGRILAGSTEENAGFVKATTAEAREELTQFAQSLVPALAKTPIETVWCGLRPASADEWPYLGRVPATTNLYIATGHFRSGLMLSPGTGRVMADVIAGKPTAMSIEPFAIDRLLKDRSTDSE